MYIAVYLLTATQGGLREIKTQYKRKIIKNKNSKIIIMLDYKPGDSEF